jgi:hypothetical protein
MKKVIAQTLDKLALSVFAPSFVSFDETTANNNTLIHSPLTPPESNNRIPIVFQKRIKINSDIEIFHYTFESQTQTASFRNNTVHGRYFKLRKKQPRSTAILLHGLCEHSYRHINSYVARLTDSGHDCITMALPYHQERSSNWSLIGRQLMGPDLHAMLEGLQQAVKDILNIINWLASNGENLIGTIGINMGAYIAGIASSISRKLGYAILIAPLTTPIQAIGFEINGSQSPSSRCLLGLSSVQLNRIMDPWELINNIPITPKKRIMIVTATHSPFSPVESTMKLWQGWGMPQMQEYEHGYIGLRCSKQVIEDIIDFLDTRVSSQINAGLR